MALTASELRESLRALRPLEPSGAFLINGLPVMVMMQANGRTVKLQLAEAAAYLIVMVGQPPVDARQGVTSLEVDG